MARIIERSSDLKRQYRVYQLLRILFVLGGVISCCLALVSLFIPIVMGVMVLIALICFFLAGYASKQCNVYRTGVNGEDEAAEIVAQLPEGYYGFQNVKVTFDGKTSELDMVVVGQTGVFVIETKNMNGTIEGNTSEAYWEQHKVGRGGTPYSNQFYSPVKQVGTHVYRLANYLRRNRIQVRVEAMVFFANPETKIYIQGEQEKIPVYSMSDKGAYRVCQRILEGTANLPVKKVKEICRVIHRSR